MKATRHIQTLKAVKAGLATFALGLFLAGCGEALQATYSGNVKVTGHLGTVCAPASGEYSVDVTTAVSGNDISFRLSNIKKTSGNGADYGQYIQNFAPVTANLVNDVEFQAYNVKPSRYDQGSVTVGGDLERDRSAISSFRLSGTIYDNSSGETCGINLVATEALKQR